MAATAGLVNINTLAPGVAGAGTGIVLSSTGEVVTNNHVVAGATSINVTDHATGTSYSAVVLGADPRHDIPVIVLRDASGLPVAPIADSDALDGDSGGPMINAAGVIGMDVAADTSNGFAIPINTVIAVAHELTGSSANGLERRGLDVTDPLVPQGQWGRGMPTRRHTGL